MIPVFFDLDGTLTDPCAGITRCVSYALERLTADVPASNQLRSFIGPPLRDSFASVLPAERVEEAVDLYRQRFAQTGWRENQVYAGIPELLRRLVKHNWSLYVATSKPHPFAEQILEHFRLREYFSAVYGSELDGQRADKRDLLNFALRSEGISGASIMIGDRKHDAIGAHANDMQFIGVSYGYGEPGELQRAGACDIVPRPADLFAAIQRASVAYDDRERISQRKKKPC